ncbi:MAG TPA: hypothetical protein VK921_11795, partial [Anditalea sp.]|nr:hypothetical protein [Anditalea sp.]
MKKLIYIFLFCILFSSIELIAQTVPMGTPLMEEYLRRQQLIGNLDPNVSFIMRTLHPAAAFNLKNGLDLDSTFTDLPNSEFHSSFGDKGRFMMMPV